MPWKRRLLEKSQQKGVCDQALPEAHKFQIYIAGQFREEIARSPCGLNQT